MEKKQHKIGEQFEMYKIIYEIKECESCKDCALYCKEENQCTDVFTFEPCSNIVRKDHKDIIFVKVGETKD